LEVYAAKSVDMTKVESHSGGRAGWEAAVQREVDALQLLASVPGVVRFREMVTEPNGALHLIME
jgi:hypothetical protein